jgi:hypothetical protein
MIELSIHKVDMITLHPVQIFPDMKNGAPGFATRSLTVTDDKGVKITLRLYADNAALLGVQEEYLP